MYPNKVFILTAPFKFAAVGTVVWIYKELHCAGICSKVGQPAPQLQLLGHEE